MNDNVNNPKHYTAAGGVECIEVTEHFNFCIGNAIKYIWRCMDKHKNPLEDLKKAQWYIQRQIASNKEYETSMAAFYLIDRTNLKDWQKKIIKLLAVGWDVEALQVISNQINIHETGFK